MEWQLSEAQSRLSELMTEALTSGPQRITWDDQAVIVLSKSEYERLIGARLTLKDHLLNGPGLSDLDLRRDQSPVRDVTL